MLRLAPGLTLAVFLLPVLAGLAGTVLPAFGVLPALGATEPSLEPWRALFATPGFGHSLLLTLVTGFGATVLAVACSAALAASLATPGSGRAGRIASRLSPILLAAPHAAVALGFAFLILPSGWIARAISPELTGWTRPPDLATARDPYGISLMLGLAVKETPYLLASLLASSGFAEARRRALAARALGSSPRRAFLLAGFPALYPQWRLPIFAALAFSLGSVEPALLLGPGTPAPLAVVVTRAFSDYDLAAYAPAAAGALLVAVLSAAAILAWLAIERGVAWLGRAAVWSGRGFGAEAVGRIAAGLGLSLVAAGVAGLGGLVLWSFAERWTFPDAWPATLTGETWGRALGDIALPTTLGLGLASTGVALLLSLACLENEARRGARAANALALLYVPLLVPAVAFLFGWQALLVRAGIDGTHFAVAWAHLVFVLPYVFLALAGPFRALDPRLPRAAAALGAHPVRIFFRVKLPLLLRPLLLAAALGFAVSVGQYLSTLFAGAGRVATLTTEAVSLGAGADRRLSGALGALQAALPLAAYALAHLVPRWLHRNRRGVA